MGVLPTLLKGATVVLEAGFVRRRALELIERHRATSISGVPTTYQMICEHPAWADTDISSLRILTCGGSAVPARVLDAYEARGLSFTGGYGMTETSPGATSLPAALLPGEGRARPGCRTSSPTCASPTPTAGELPARPRSARSRSRGPNVIAGYWNRPEATADSFADGGWFRSGDLGHVDEDGFLYISDRLKDMIISGGENVYPAEIERIILELDGGQGVSP